VNVTQPVPAAPRVFPAWLLRLRGLLAVPVAVALVLGAPGLAYGAFTARTTTASLSVGTYKIPAPASIDGTLHCTDTGKGATITFTAFGLVDRATSYVATLALSGDTPALTPITAGRQVSMTAWAGKGTYTFTLSARVGSWTGAPLVRTVTC
jgi:hypothetical protein